MAKLKPAGETKKTDQQKAVSEKAESEKSEQVSQDQAIALRDRHPALSTDEVVFFGSRQPVALAREVGGGTTAADVLPDTVRVGARFEHARSTSKVVAEYISPALMRWLFEHIVKLGDAVAQRDRHGATTTEVSVAVQAAFDAARAPRNKLSDAMVEYAKGSEADAAALSKARGEVHKPDQMLASLTGLAGVAEKWLARTDAQARIAAREAALTEALVGRVKDAATVLKTAIDGDTAHVGSRVTSRDTPEINTLEGRVILTLRTVLHNHRRAMNEDATIPPVQIPESLRNALRIKSKTKAVDTPVDPNASGATPAAPAAPKKKSRRKTR